MANGSLMIAKWAGGALITGLLFMGKGIVDNNNRHTATEVEIRKEVIEGDKEIYSKIDKVEDIVTEIRVEQATIVTTLKQIEKKL